MSRQNGTEAATSFASALSRTEPTSPAISCSRQAGSSTHSDVAYLERKGWRTFELRRPYCSDRAGFSGNRETAEGHIVLQLGIGRTALAFALPGELSRRLGHSLITFSATPTAN